MTEAGYTVVTFDDTPDLSGDAPGEFRMLTKPLSSEQVAVSYRQLPPDSGGIHNARVGHSHKTQEEIYFVISGTVQVKVGDDVVELGPRTAIRFEPSTVRAVWNPGPDAAELIFVSTTVDDLRAEVEMDQDFWPEP